MLLTLVIKIHLMPYNFNGVNNMNSSELVATISAIACTISKCCSDEEITVQFNLYIFKP